MGWTTQEIVNAYQDGAFEISNSIAKLNEFRNRFENISEFVKDNADPAIDLGEAIEKLGIALSSVVIYANEYEKDLKKENDSNEHSK